MTWFGGSCSAAIIKDDKKQEAPGKDPGRLLFRSCRDAYSSSSTIPAGTSCGAAGSSTRGGGAS